MKPEPAPDYVVIGHVTHDRFRDRPVATHGWSPRRGDAERPGGTAYYAGVAALRLGRTVGLVTSFGADFRYRAMLAPMQIARVPAERTTCFEIASFDGRRQLRSLHRAGELSFDAAAASWRAADIVHCAPVAGEVRTSVIRDGGRGHRAATLQGWLRTHEDGQLVQSLYPADFPASLDGLDWAVVSTEDLGGSDAGRWRSRAEELAAHVGVLAVTEGAQGCALYAERCETYVEPFPAREVDSTGAGDVFAAAFFIRLSETRDPTESARFAACAAALSVEGVGASRVPNRREVLDALRQRRGVTVAQAESAR
ncbi:MAG TPA: PfkB family carbohydrate kinase [Chloroflexota bacterium]|nr:PfkB family carbohydrate kinase [Chloroflexota bacterium]